MSLRAHLRELKEKHRDLDGEIKSYSSHLGIDALKVVRLKREKLRLKDEIRRISDSLEAELGNRG